MLHRLEVEIQPPWLKVGHGGTNLIQPRGKTVEGWKVEVDNQPYNPNLC